MAMDERPVTRYAKAPDGVSLAYQVVGDGPPDVVWLQSLSIPIDLLWEEPGFARFAKRLHGFSRNVWCDGRGLGASGGDAVDWSIDALMDDDITAVLDAADCESVVLVATNYTGPRAIRYTTTHPNRVQALVLINTFAYYLRDADCPWGLPANLLEQLAASMAQAWESGASLDYYAPSKAGDEAFRSWYSRSEHLGFAPDHMASLMLSAFGVDARPLLPDLAVPTLVLHRQGDKQIRVSAGRYLAEHISGVRYVELPGEDHLFFTENNDLVADEIEDFLTGTRQGPEGDTLTTTVLFTDIVASTEQSARLGHRAWSNITNDHNAMVRASLARYRGHEVKTLGDGFLVTFDATTRAMRAATEIVTAAKGLGIEVRAGVHVGEVEVRADDVIGLPVSIAKRVCDLAGPGEVFVSRAVTDLVTGSGLRFEDRGEHELKGVPGAWRLFVVAT
jgi:class 3 adenylate cyclase